MFTPRSPSPITIRTTCPECGAEMPIRLVEPACDGKQVNNHVFMCGECGKTEVYSFDWTDPINEPVR